ncbi:MAG: NUDIX hydrolase [Kocuria sp.]|nr:NUDIX hydrolase [Kocuria sp.]
MQNSLDPTRRLRRFALLPQYRQAAQVWQEANGQLAPVTPVDAVGVVVLRDGPRGAQTFLCAHPPRSPFGPLAFPGGTADPVDDEPLPWIGPSARDWARRWHDDVGAIRRSVVAAARELFERTGVLVAGSDKYSTVVTGDGREWATARENVADRSWSMRHVLEMRRLRLRTDLLWPIARWISPEFLHRRYDTRFFAVILPERQNITGLPGQSKPGVWVDVDQLNQPQSWVPEVLGHSASDIDQGRLFAAATMELVQDLSAARSVVEIIAKPRDLSARMPVLSTGPDGDFWLTVPPLAKRRRTWGDAQ